MPFTVTYTQQPIASARATKSHGPRIDLATPLEIQKLQAKYDSKLLAHKRNVLTHESTKASPLCHMQFVQCLLGEGQRYQAAKGKVTPALAKDLKTSYFERQSKKLLIQCFNPVLNEDSLLIFHAHSYDTAVSRVSKWRLFSPLETPVRVLVIE